MNLEDRLKNAESLDLGGPDSETKASLYLYADDIDIQAISTSLGCEPTHAHRQGEVVKRKPPARIGLWSLDAPKDLYFPDKLAYLIKNTTSSHNIWDELASKHKIALSCAVFLHRWTDGFEIPAELLAEIGTRHWQFGISVYSAEGDEIVDAFLRVHNDTSNK